MPVLLLFRSDFSLSAPKVHDVVHFQLPKSYPKILFLFPAACRRQETNCLHPRPVGDRGVRSEPSTHRRSCTDGTTGLVPDMMDMDDRITADVGEEKNMRITVVMGNTGVQPGRHHDRFTRSSFAPTAATQQNRP